MKDYDPVSSFSDEASARFHDTRGDEAECVAFLKDLAGDGPALELAIGTGRVALPLADEGIRVDGIDFSTHMVARLREKPGGDKLSVQIADFTDVAVEDSYILIYIVWNSFFNLLEQENQIRCFENVARHLTRDGVFVIEVFTPDFLYRDSSQVKAESIGVESVRIGVMQHDPANQLLEQTHVTLSSNGTRLDPVMQRYCWPSELDLMARLAGLELKARWGGWNREVFDSESHMHVSVYGR